MSDDEAEELLTENARLRTQHKRLRAINAELLDVAKCLRQHLALFCGPDDAIANEIFAISDAAIEKAKGE